MNIDLLPGDVLLTHDAAGDIGRLIRFGERVRILGWWRAIWRQATLAKPVTEDPWWVNHAAVYVGDGQIIEALANGLNLDQASKYAEGTYVVARLAAVAPNAGDTERDNLVAYARAMFARHEKYGWLSIFSVVLQILTPIRFDISWDGAVICSAFAAQCWEHAGITLTTRSALTTMPSDLAQMANPGKTTP